jgi:N-hydroxyarylamine O-acetyltransferase
MDLDAYFDRIGYAGPRDASVRTLAAIAARHAMSIPFENIGVLASGVPDLELPALERKLVRARRGGYCFEQNGLLLGALEMLGFAVTPLSARVVYRLPPGTITARSHMVMCVTTPDGRMLVDAGFGGLTLTAPVALDTPDPQRTPHETVRLVAIDDGSMLQALVEDEWRDLYRFDFIRQHAVDYVQQNWYTATRPGALFTSNLVAALPTTDGRYALFNRTLTRRARSGTEERRTIDTPEDLRACLASIFGIVVSEAELAKAWAVSGQGAAGQSMFG